ncbi:MAG: cytochrome c peroxidase, partial [Pirellulales bacterium]
GAVPAVPEEKLTDPAVMLGRALFWDERLSIDGKTACASCHSAEDWGADSRRFSLDARGKHTARNSQTVFNAVLQPQLRWTGDRTSGAHQAERSLAGSMGFASPEAVVPVLKETGYEAAFQAAFPDDAAPISPSNYAAAIQAYEETLITPSALDLFLAGEGDALDAHQKTGLDLFVNVGCADCHSGALLGGDSLRTFGVAKEYWTATLSEKRDAGLYETTQRAADRYKFRVPMLRNIAKTAPYFHDGSVADLIEAVQVMADVQLGDRLLDSEAAAIAAFLEALTGEVPSNYGPPTSNQQ